MNAQFVLHISDKPVTLNQNQSHQTYNKNENVDLKQGYNYEKFEIPHFNSIQEKGYIKVFLQMRKCVNYLPRTCAKIKKIMIY